MEASLVLPFFLSILLAFFTFFGQYALKAELSMQAARDAKQLGIAMSSQKEREGADITIFKTGQIVPLWLFPFEKEQNVTERAVCRAWVGFTEPENSEVLVYITPGGSVYHLSRDCTHLKLSVRAVTINQALGTKNKNGAGYRRCALCKASAGLLVYVTGEGECYHTERSCSGLKRTVRLVPLRQVEQRGCCLRCMERSGVT